MPKELDRRGMAVLSGGHTFTDMGQGAVPAMLPFMIDDRGYSIAAASSLVLAATVASSIVQPVFGAASDRRSLPWLMPGGLVLTGVGIGLAGVAPSYWLTFAAILLSGLGVAAFHPEASRFANYLSGARRATGMSLFSVGGNAGFALGPIVVTPLVLALGLEGMLIAGLLPVLMALVLTRELGRLKSFHPDHEAAESTRAQETWIPDQWGAFTRLAVAVGVRSGVYFGLAAFVPLYFIAEFNASKADANTALTVMLVAGAAGTLIGGRLADRVGRRPVFAVSTLSLTPLILGFLAADRTLAIVLLAFIGAMIIATFSVTVVMGQEYLPNRIGVASGVTLGLAIGVGGVAASVLGALADRTSVETAMYVIAFTPLLAAVLALSLPRATTAVAAR